MLHVGEAHFPPACIFHIHFSLKAVWSFYVPGPPTFKIAGYAPACYSLNKLTEAYTELASCSTPGQNESGRDHAHHPRPIKPVILYMAILGAQNFAYQALQNHK